MKVVVHDSPIGGLTLAVDGDQLVGVWFDRDERALAKADGEGSERILSATRRELDRYFAGQLRDFTVPVAPRGTPFQRKVWSALRSIPYGGTTSYGAVARQIGRSSAVRAVGTANGANPIPIIIPCHRVIGANGSLTGFGGGLDRKRFLLDLERGVAPLL